MGRGRQKAKHTKVARELKYFSPEVDITALERELVHPDENELIDKWADLFPEAADKDAAGDAELDAGSVPGADASSAGGDSSSSASAGSDSGSSSD